MKYNGEVDGQSRSVLFYAINSNSPEIVKLLLKSPQINVNFNIVFIYILHSFK